MSRLQNPNLCVFMNFDKCETISIVSQFYFRSDQPSSSEIPFSSNHFSWMQFNPIRFYSHRISFSLLYTGPMFFFLSFRWFLNQFFLLQQFSLNFFFFFCHRIKILAESCIWIPNYFSDFQVRVSWFFFLSLYLSVSFGCFLFTLSFQQIYVY